jgi:hypothetical protein
LDAIAPFFPGAGDAAAFMVVRGEGAAESAGGLSR